MDLTTWIFNAAEWIGTIAFAISGAMIAIDRKLDLFGIIFLGVVTAVGGGSVRDVILGHVPPRMFYNYHYVLIAALTAVTVFIAVRRHRNGYFRNRERIDRYNNLFDAIGLGAFAVTGVEVAMNAGYGTNAFLCIFLGMTTGVGGGILRDMLSRRLPYVLHKHVYALAAIAGSGLYYLMARLQINDSACTLAGMAVTIFIRLMAAHYHWNLPKTYEE